MEPIDQDKIGLEWINVYHWKNKEKSFFSLGINNRPFCLYSVSFFCAVYHNKKHMIVHPVQGC